MCLQYINAIITQCYIHYRWTKCTIGDHKLGDIRELDLKSTTSRRNSTAFNGQKFANASIQTLWRAMDDELSFSTRINTKLILLYSMREAYFRKKEHFQSNKLVYTILLTIFLIDF